MVLSRSLLRSVAAAGLLAATLPSTAAADATQQLGVVLEPRDPAGLKAFADAVSTPGSAQFGQYLRRGEFAERFGPAPATVERVQDALREAGLRPGDLPPNSLVLPVTGTEAAVEAALDVPGAQARARGSDRSDDVLRVLELGRRGAGARASARTVSAPSRRAATARATAPTPCAAAQTAAAGISPSPWLFDDLATAYDFTRVRAAGGWGAGVTVALMEWEPYLASDIQAFQDCYGTNATVVNVDVAGGPGTTVNDSEATLDIQTVIATAPEATVLVYQAPGTMTRDQWLGVFGLIAANDTADVISTSWGGCEANSDDTWIAAQTTFLQQMAAQGQSAMAAAGDDGSEDCGGAHTTLGVDDPGSDPYMLSVGGTALAATGDPPATRPTETVWNSGTGGGAGGGGVSEVHRMPAWQRGPGVIGPRSSGTPCAAPSGELCRQVPDVSALADWNRGYLFYYSPGSGGAPWYQDGGTSAASPLWAGMIASITSVPSCGGRRLGLLAPRLYPLAAAGGSAAFNDITIGTNDLSGLNPGHYDAGLGYDMASGLGSPVGGGLLAGLCPAAPVPTPSGGGGGEQASVPTEQLPATPAADPAPAPAPPATTPVPPSAPRVELLDEQVTAARGGRITLGLGCPAGGPDCRVDVRVRGDGVDLRVRDRRIEAGDRRGLRLRLPVEVRDRRRQMLRVTITTRTATGEATVVRERIVVRGTRR